MLRKMINYFTSTPQRNAIFFGLTILLGEVIFFILLCTGIVVVQ